MSQYDRIPKDIRLALDDYVKLGTPTGSFLRAVLANNLMAAVCHADPDSLAELKTICLLVHNEMPSACHGSLAVVREWIEKHQQEQAP